MNNTTYIKHKIVKYFRKTWKNKVLALFLLGVSYMPVIMCGEGGGFVLMLMFAVPMFFAKTNWTTF